MRTPDIFQVGTMVTAAAAFVAGGIWIGAIEVKAENALLAAGKVSKIQIDQAVIRERVHNLNEKLDEQERRSKERAKLTDKKLDAVLKEIRRRNTRGR